MKMGGDVEVSWTCHLSFSPTRKKFQSVEKLSEQIHLDREQANKLVNQK